MIISDAVLRLYFIGNWSGEGKFKLWFNHGGAIEFGQAMLHAGRLGGHSLIVLFVCFLIM